MQSAGTNWKVAQGGSASHGGPTDEPQRCAGADFGLRRSYTYMLQPILATGSRMRNAARLFSGTYTPCSGVTLATQYSSISSQPFWSRGSGYPISSIP